MHQCHKVWYNNATLKQVKDVRVPEQLMRAMAAEAEAARNARAKVIIVMMMILIVTMIMTIILLMNMQ